MDHQIHLKDVLSERVYLMAQVLSQKRLLGVRVRGQAKAKESLTLIQQMNPLLLVILGIDLMRVLKEIIYKYVS